MRVQAAAARLRTKLQQLGQTVTQTADGRLSIAAFQVNLTDRQRERIRSLVLRIDLPAAETIHTVSSPVDATSATGEHSRSTKQQAATELIAAGVSEPAHREAFIQLGRWPYAEPAQWPLITQSLLDWSQEHKVQPSDLGARMTYLADAESKTKGPDCDFALSIN